MKFVVHYCVVLLFITFYRSTNASFLYGQPCSERNTAYLYVMTWKLPDKNEINCVDITGFKKSMSATHMNLTNYKYFFQMASAADTLYADHMIMKRFPIAIVHLLKNIEMIDASSNNITKVPPKMHKIAPKLNKLLLSENKIMIPKKRPLMYSLTLITLILSDNGINNLYKFTFLKLPALEVLYLDNNNLKFVSPAMFAPMKNLKYLHLGRNYLSQIPPMPIKNYIIKSQHQIKRRSLYRKNVKDTPNNLLA